MFHVKSLVTYLRNQARAKFLELKNLNQTDQIPYIMKDYLFVDA